MDKESRWLNSDSQILARVKKSPHKQGQLVSLTMPWGEECQAVVEKWNAASAQQFCELARGMYDARKDEQEAKQARAAFDRQIAEDERAANAPSEEAAPAPEATVAFDPFDPESIAARLSEIRDRERIHNRELNRLRVERTKLTKILEVLQDAQEDDGEELPSLSGDGQQEETDTMDRGPRERTLLSLGEEDSSEPDSES